ncbi:MAG: hypothetical protein TECD_01071 [Hyphomicrobiaceae bacterium hypho_1]
MSNKNANVEWFLARNGQQYGPLSNTELDKFIELGHLRPSDLVWRAGFEEWLTADQIFPVGQLKTDTFVSTNPESNIPFHNSECESGNKSYTIITLASAILTITMLGGWLVYSNRVTLERVILDTAKTSYMQLHSIFNTTFIKINDAIAVKISQSHIPTQNISHVEPKLALLSTKFWNDIRNQDEVWARRQEKSLAKLRTNSKSEAERLKFAVKALVNWRRQNADKILTANPNHLRQLAKTFTNSLKYLANQNIKACYGFISQGELSPSVLKLYNNKTHLAVLGEQVEAIVAAAKNKNLTLELYPEPNEDDFKTMTRLLNGRGWTQEDIDLFSNPAALSSAPEAKVCKLVTEWFEVQLNLSSSSSQIRLLAASLRPVIRG